MKKMMMVALMAAATTTALAQSEVVKNAKKLFDKGQFEEALKEIQPALNEGTDADKATAWNIVSETYYKKFSDIQDLQFKEKVQPTGKTIDEKTMNESILKALEAAMKCDEYDNLPNEKGKVKPRFRQASQQKYQTGRLGCINAGQWFYNQKDYKNAFNSFALYITSGDSPMFEGIDLKDQYKGEISYFASLSAYQEKDYPNVIKYANLALSDTARSKDATEILVFAKKETMKNAQDTLEYIDMLKKASQQFPEDQRYSAWIGDYYLNSGKTAELSAWADAEIAKNPDDKFAYVFKGEALRNMEKFDEAVDCYKKAFELDPTYLAAAYQAGVSLNSKAIKLKDELSDKKTGLLTKANADKVKNVLQEAKGYLEKVRELDPEHEQVNWVYALYQLYYNLGDKTKADELEKLLNQ